MNKDVIYIDVEDDITGIISKIKASNEKIIALVPPKRTGVLQSAVNLRLLARAAKTNDKRVVLISSNASLVSLAAAAAIPVAKNLQSKPELVEPSSLDSDDSVDVIDGNEVPIGEHAKMAPGADPDGIDEAAETMDDIPSTPPPRSSRATKPSKKSRAKVPNFSSFRKKLFFGITGGIALIAFLVWAIFFAPHATIVIAAKTTSSSVNTDVVVGDKLKTDAKKGTLKAVLASQSEDISQDFTATGSKNVGNKATGTVQFSTNSITALGTTIPAGTKLVSGGLAYITQSDVTITISNYNNAPTTVEAAEVGAKYNAASGSMSGAPNNIDATLVDPTSGGTDKIVKVVKESDVQKAKQSLVDQNTDDIINQLKGKFEGDVVVLEDTFMTDYANVTSNPAVGVEAAGGNATLTGKVTYKMYAVARSEIDEFLKATLTDTLDNKDEQRIYDTGAADAQFQDVVKKTDGGEATLIATGQVGPKIDEKEVKENAKGKKFGDIQADIQSIQGVDSVDIKFFPFWVSTVPDDSKKVTVQFKLDESN